MTSKPIAPCFGLNNNAVEAVDYYISVFKNSKLLHVDRYSDVGPDPEAPVVFIEFRINGQPFQAINVGPELPFAGATSLCIERADQEEVDYYWNTLTAEGEPSECGRLKDTYGVSWQIVPSKLSDLLLDSDRERAGRVMQRALKMSRLNFAELLAGYDESPELR